MFLEDMARVRYYPLGNILPQCIDRQWEEETTKAGPKRALGLTCLIQRDSNTQLDTDL